MGFNTTCHANGNLSKDLDRDLYTVRNNLLNLRLCYPLSKIFNSEGYVNGPHSDFYYYRRDHLGNNREVWNANTNTTVQRTQYYPSGLPWASNCGDNPGTQSKKYNGKEWVEMHGLDEYDSEARWYYPAIVRTTTIDPLAEKFYDISPYAWCEGDPINYIDPDGRAKIKAAASFNVTSGIVGIAAKVFGIGVQSEFASGIKNGIEVYVEFDTKNNSWKFGVARNNIEVKGNSWTSGPYSGQDIKEKKMTGSGDLNNQDGPTKTKPDEKLKATDETGGFGPLKSNEYSEPVKIDLTVGASANAGMVGVELKAGIEITEL